LTVSPEDDIYGKVIYLSKRLAELSAECRNLKPSALVKARDLCQSTAEHLDKTLAQLQRGA
jgi:hypothetical protein